MTDREKYLTILDRFYRGRGGSLLTKDESEALDYAISSIKTDLKYDLLYEETKHIADTDKMMESTTKNCRTCKNFGSHHGICEICKDNKCWTEITKNDLGVDCISRKVMRDLGATCIAYRNYKQELIPIITIDELPSVTPQEPKTGYWVEETINEWSRKVFCSECGCPPPFEHVSNGDVYSASGYGVINKTKYCPNCGAKMVEPQENEG